MVKELKKKVLDEGTGGYTQPETGANVNITYYAKYTIDKNDKNEENWKQFAEEANIKLIIDDDEIKEEEKNNPRYVEGFHIAIQDMKKASTVIFAIDSIKGYGEKGNEKYGIPPNATLIYQITLHDFENVKKNMGNECGRTFYRK